LPKLYEESGCERSNFIYVYCEACSAGPSGCAERGNLQQTAGHGDILEEVDELVLLAEVSRSDSAEATLN
jgi:hypothetical protein